ncbi:hypothetical protein FRC00_001098 [Tulasnella sp. 408]|nr:hypothetical protein FRC00_001098 [Tulasnella sp. 408]
MKNSSKTLEKPIITENFVFTGLDGLNCHQFIKAIRENALKEGRQRDYEWMADFASIRFEEEALQWFESLGDETQSDWRLLRRAILSRYAEAAYEGAGPHRE